MFIENGMTLTTFRIYFEQCFILDSPEAKSTLLFSIEFHILYLKSIVFIYLF